ncbi:MAG: hypothetical protein ACRDK1_05795 [Solirubrobacterales bacterium]
MPEPDQPATREPPSEEELRAQIEEQLRTVRVQDLLLDSTVSLLNLSARRIAKEDERDLEQARVGIEAVRAMVELLDPEPAKQIRTALSEVQVLFARQAQGGQEPSQGDAEAAPEPPTEPAAPAEAPSRPQGGPQRPPSKLWTPPGT